VEKVTLSRHLIQKKRASGCLQDLLDLEILESG